MVACDNIFQLRFKSHYDYIKKCYFPSQIYGQRVFIFKISINEGKEWNIVKIVYSFRDPIIKMVDKKWTCLFH
jgi:hypothetical protein